jgi:hypothetical protein
MLKCPGRLTPHLSIFFLQKLRGCAGHLVINQKGGTSVCVTGFGSRSSSRSFAPGSVTVEFVPCMVSPIAITCVLDFMCPWSFIGLKALETAMLKAQGTRQGARQQLQPPQEKSSPVQHQQQQQQQQQNSLSPSRFQLDFIPFEFDPPGTYPAGGTDWTQYCRGYGPQLVGLCRRTKHVQLRQDRLWLIIVPVRYGCIRARNYNAWPCCPKIAMLKWPGRLTPSPCFFLNVEVPIVEP